MFAIDRLPLPALLVLAELLVAARVLRRFRLVFNAVKAHFQQVERTAGIGGSDGASAMVRPSPSIRRVRRGMPVVFQSGAMAMKARIRTSG